jgi:hypothetical protein
MSIGSAVWFERDRKTAPLAAPQARDGRIRPYSLRVRALLWTGLAGAAWAGVGGLIWAGVCLMQSGG